MTFAKPLSDVNVGQGPLSGYARGSEPGSGNNFALTDDVWVPVEAKHPGQELVYTEYTDNVSITATTENTANTIVTATTIEYDGKPVLIEFFAPRIEKGTNSTIIWLYLDGSSIGRLTDSDSGTNGGGGGTFQRRLSPTKGPHTYSIRGSVDAGTGTVYGQTGGSGNKFVPGFIRITRAAGGNS